MAGYSEIAPGIWGMSAGDANADKAIDMYDKNIEWSNDAGTPGYKATDFNMDGQVDNPDKVEGELDNLGKVSPIPN